MGAIVSAEDLAKLEATECGERPGGALATVGALAEFDEWEQLIEEVIGSRASRPDRDVVFG